jgi:hypothetical protein
MDGVREVQDLIEQYNAVMAKWSEPDADYDAIGAEQSALEDKINAADAWNVERNVEIAMDALRCPPDDQDVDDAVGWRARACALAGSCSSTRPAAARRADEPPRCRVGRLARALPRRVRGHRRRRHPRPLLPRQRRQVDPRARPRPRHPFSGNYSSWLEQKLDAYRASRRRPMRASARSPASSNGSASSPKAAPVEGQGPPRRLREAAGRGQRRQGPDGAS